jgi:nucleotide-binding universal stress UspA family protein
MKILCPTDFSDRARAASRVAVDLAGRTGGSVELLHVVPPRLDGAFALAAGAVAPDDQLRTSGQTRLAAECRELAPGGVAITSWLAEGEVESSILERARTLGADLIVMGAHGRPVLERLVLGSVAERTVRRADRPVLIVPPGAGPPGVAAKGRAGLRVMVAFDGRPASQAALGFVRALRRRVPCDVTLLRLYWPVEEFQRLGLIGPRPMTSPDPEVVADLSRDLRAEMVTLSGAVPGAGETDIAVEPAWGEPAARILDAAAARGSDLVVMGAESRRGLARIAHPPVASRVARQAMGVPIVFVPAAPPVAAPVEVPVLASVLCPTDLSTTGNRAVPFAYALLAAHGGVVELVYVHERSLPVPPFAYEDADHQLTAEERTRIERELRALVPSDADRLGIISHVTVIDGGTAAEAIPQAAERLAVDAITLGTHRHGGGVYRALLGSVAQDVARHARRPVFVIPSSTQDAS